MQIKRAKTVAEQQYISKSYMQIKRAKTVAEQQYISKSYMQIKRAKTVAEYLSSACRTATFCTIPGLH